jgi:hypothetical protein
MRRIKEYCLKELKLSRKILSSFVFTANPQFDAEKTPVPHHPAKKKEGRKLEQENQS